jgi:hypothetical protein
VAAGDLNSTNDLLLIEDSSDGYISMAVITAITTANDTNPKITGVCQSIRRPAGFQPPAGVASPA